MNPRTAEPTSNLGAWLRRKRALLALLRNDRYRRDVLALLALNLRASMSWRLVLGLLALAAAGGWLLMATAPAPNGAQEILQGLFLLATVAAGAGIYSSEKDQGTFELLWLASGSERALLRIKIATTLMLLGAVQFFSVLMVSLLLPEPFPVLKSFSFLVTGSFFVLAVMALIGTWLPHAWSAGLAGLAILGGIYLYARGMVSTLNPFTNPVPSMLATPPPFQKGPDMILTINRAFLLVFSTILLDISARRLRRVL